MSATEAKPVPAIEAETAPATKAPIDIFSLPANTMLTTEQVGSIGQFGATATLTHNNVPADRFKNSVPPVRGAQLGEVMTARWFVGKSANSIRAAGGSRVIARHGEPIEASTFSLTGGGSAALTLRRAFTIASGDGQVVFVRTGSGKNHIHAIYAESSSTGMAQADGAPRREWEASARFGLQAMLPAVISAVLNGQRTPSVPAAIAAVEPGL